ncbi:MAG: WcaF family extracellular polysaccharide biosynthesis acetyltransferase [Romboutsia timonensis]|uniref:WcaF family extracellular polysaccharide biosynthesis acetyltransferase n=1 Tax=Romboutsia timonensis TaxID=1776391 RepID=UPI002A7475B1|nr:WcaF family extracellular polysaccharide biosynthesis acetyltransferase [Romboutsia timonensis]MDY2884040.1 WcaF family extracellular polysaccharide biosynthesis acetyltransferase [Romboutsia timonensis]
MKKVDLSKYDQSWFDRGKPSYVIFLWWIVQSTIFKWSLHNMYGFRNFILRCFGADIGKNVKIRRKCEITYPWKLKVKDNTWIDDEVLIYNLENIYIGANCSITRRSFLCTGNHDIEDSKFGLIVKPINVDDGVWIQADCFISQGVDIGQNVVVRARSTVLKSLEENKVYQGTPCKPVKDRNIKK